MRILVVEDEKALNKVLTKHLKKNGYSVDSCFDGISAKEHLQSDAYDAVILDIIIPGMNGFELLQWMRAGGSDASVLMLTAMDSTEDKVKGLDLGADDYLTKPFALEELMARIRLITRKRTGNRSNIFTIGDLSVDMEKHTAVRAGREIILSAKEFSMLSYMVMNKGRVLSREQFLSHLWDYDYEGASNMVDVYIRHLRKKVDEGHERKLIHTVRGNGYVMREES